MRRPHALLIAMLSSLCVMPAIAYACGNVMIQNYIPSTEAWLLSGPVALFSILALQKHKRLSVAHQLVWVASLATIPNILIVLVHSDPKWILLGINVQGAFGLFVYALTVARILEKPTDKPTSWKRKAVRLAKGLGILCAALALGVMLEKLEPEQNEFYRETLPQFDPEQREEINF